MNVTSLTVNITSFSLSFTSDDSQPSSASPPIADANVSQDRVNLSSLLSNPQTVSANVAQQGQGDGRISLDALTQDFRQAFDTYAANGQPIQGHGHHHHGHHHAHHGSDQATSLNTSDVQHALDQLTTTLQQQADSNGTVSKATLRQDIRQLFSSLHGESDTPTSAVQTVA